MQQFLSQLDTEFLNKELFYEWLDDDIELQTDTILNSGTDGEEKTNLSELSDVDSVGGKRRRKTSKKKKKRKTSKKKRKRAIKRISTKIRR